MAAKPYAPRCGLTGDAVAICQLLRAEIVRVGWSRTAKLSGIDLGVANALGLEFTVRRRS